MKPGDMVRYTFNPFFFGIILDLVWDDYLMTMRANVLFNTGLLQGGVLCDDLEVLHAD